LRELTYCEAINEAIDQEMARDDSIIIFGIGVPDHKKIFGSTVNLLEKYGPSRCFDTPLAEEAMTGFALGAALQGLKPIHVHIRVDFLLLAMNQLVNMISSYNYTTGSHFRTPILIRAIIGRGWGQGSQHSKSLHSYFAHIPGLKVILPTTASDAKGMITSAIRDDSPVICLEHRWLYWATDKVPEEAYETPIGIAKVLREGSDITIVGTSWMNIEALRAADILFKYRGVKAEVIDVRSLYPLDADSIARSVAKTGFCIIADNDWTSYGAGGEIAALTYEKCFDSLKKPIRRVGFAHAPCPTVRCLENEFYPNAETIVRECESILDLEPISLSDELFYSHERRFKGPF
jgi:acetoin:2,6-dichlorophenolindophenol oxidoreductase subunit beta